MDVWLREIFTWLTELGYWGILLGLMIEVIPSELVLSYGGYLVSQGKITFLGAVIYGTIGGTLAQIFLYWIGRYGGRPFLEKYGKYILIRKKHIDMAEQWFERYGAGVIFTARFVPVVRHAISIPAGIANMSFVRFTVLTALAVIPWSVFFIYLGMVLGDNWQHIDEKAAPYIKPFVMGAAVLTAVYFLWKGRKNRKSSANRHGLLGERHVAHQLRFVGREYRVLHRRVVKAGGSAQEIDHIVVGPNGLFHIETKHWSGEVRFSGEGMERSGERQSEDPTAQLYRHEYVIKELLRSAGIKADVVGVLCFTGENCRIIGKSPAFATLKADGLVHFIKTYRPKFPLTPEQVRHIAETVEKNSLPAKKRQ